MKRISGFLLLLMMTIGCRDKDSCHLHIQIINASDSSVFEGTVIPGANDTCWLDGTLLLPGQSKKYYPFNGCIERYISEGELIHLFIIDKHHYNDSSGYPCDSFEVINKVLKHYSLSIEDLKNNDFTVVYQ